MLFFWYFHTVNQIAYDFLWKQLFYLCNWWIADVKSGKKRVQMFSHRYGKHSNWQFISHKATNQYHKIRTSFPSCPFMMQILNHSANQRTGKKYWIVAVCLALFMNCSICKLHRDMKWAWQSMKVLRSIKNQFQSYSNSQQWQSALKRIWWHHFPLSVLSECVYMVFVCAVYIWMFCVWICILLLSPETNCHLSERAFVQI